jgi:hypothetical protein
MEPLPGVRHRCAGTPHLAKQRAKIRYASSSAKTPCQSRNLELVPDVPHLSFSLMVFTRPGLDQELLELHHEYLQDIWAFVGHCCRACQVNTSGLGVVQGTGNGLETSRIS